MLLNKNNRHINLYFLIVNYNSSSFVTRLINSLHQPHQEKYQIVIINNSVADQNIFNLESDSIKIIEPEKNMGFGRACNIGLNWIYQQHNQAIVWLINPDTYFDLKKKAKISPINQAISFFKAQPQISILGTIVYNSQGEITSAGGNFIPSTAALSTITSLPKNLKEDYIKTDWVSGCSLLINLAKFSKCPNFDPRYFLYYEDLDFCLRYGQQGHQIAVTSLLKIFHDTSSITNRNLIQKYQHITHSYLIHIEKYGSLMIFILTNIRISSNTIRLIILKPKQGLGKLIGIYSYWKTRLTNSQP